MVPLLSRSVRKFRRAGFDLWMRAPVWRDQGRSGEPRGSIAIRVIARVRQTAAYSAQFGQAFRNIPASYSGDCGRRETESREQKVPCPVFVRTVQPITKNRAFGGVTRM